MCGIEEKQYVSIGAYFRLLFALKKGVSVCIWVGIFDTPEKRIVEKQWYVF